MSRYRQLDPAKIVETARTLARRVGERFPGSGLSGVAADVADLSAEADRLADYLATPLRGLRFVSCGVTVVLLFVIVAAAAFFRVPVGMGSLGELFQGLESLINDVVFTGIAIWFLFTVEERIKRRRALAVLGQLRSLAHVIDMHQLTKDPEPVPALRLDPTASSPTRNMRPAELARYLDYCSEMLAVLGKLAALCAQRFDDPVTLRAVDELESLTTGLSQKIWQKITLIDRAGG